MTETKSAFELAMNTARVAVRSKAMDFKMLEGKIIDLFETGKEKKTGILIQSIVVQIDGEKEERRYAIRGNDSLEFVFGIPTKDGKFPKMSYDGDGVPLSIKVPDIPSQKDNQDREVYWFGLNSAKKE